MPVGLYQTTDDTPYKQPYQNGGLSNNVLKSVQEQEKLFENLTRELEAERQSVAKQVEQCRIGSETESMNSISSTDDTFQWGGTNPDESHGLVDSCLHELENRGSMHFGEDNMNYMPEDPYNTSGRGPYSSMNGGIEARHNDINSMHSSHASLQSSGSNRNRIIKGSHSSLPQDQQHNDNYAPYSALPRNYENLGRSPSHESPRGPSTPTRLNPYGYEDNYRSSPQMIYDRNSPNTLLYGGQDSLDNSMQQQQLETSSNHFEPAFRGPPDDRYGGPPPEDSFYRQSPMIEDRYGSQDNHLHGNQEPMPQDGQMAAPNDDYQDNRGNDDSFRGHPDDSYQGQPENYSGAPPPLVDRYGQPLDDSYQGGAPMEQIAQPGDRYGQPLDDSYRGQQDDSFRGQPPQGERNQDYSEDAYRGPPPDDRYEDQPPSGNFNGDPHSNSFRGDQYEENQPPDDRYNEYNEDPYSQGNRKHEGLPQVQDDPFADDPFRQKQRSLLQLREEDPYARGPSPGAGSDRMGPPQYDHMDGQPQYDQERPQRYQDDGPQPRYQDDSPQPRYQDEGPQPRYQDEVPQQYYDQDTLPSQAKMLHTPQGDYPDDGRHTPSTQGGTMRWRSPDLQEVIDYLGHPSDAIKANSAAYLTHLSYMDDGIKQKIRGLDGIPLLVDLLNSEIPEVHKNACGALKNLSYGRNNDDNKRAVKNAGGIPTLIRLLRKTQSEDVKDSVTGVLWNLSSCDDLKKPIIDDGLAVLVNVVIIPHSGWEKRSTSPYQANEPWTTVFRNATGVLRNVSSAGMEARKKLRECHGLVDSLLHTLRTAIDEKNCDNKPVENCMCTLRNLAFRIQEVSDPDFYKKRNVTLQKQKQQEKKNDNQYIDYYDSDLERPATEKVGCFGGIRQKKTGEKSKVSNTDLIPNPQLPPTSNEYRGLWSVDAVRFYLQLLAGMNPVTLEGACGAIQNLAACDWKPATEVRALVRKEKGLPSLVDLLTYEVEGVVGAAAVALRNLSIDERNKELVGKYAMKQLISNLPQENRPKEMTDGTICAVLACLIEVIQHNQDFARAFYTEDGIPRLMYLVRNRHRFSHLAVKYALAVLKAMWKFKVLHSNYHQLGYFEKDFIPLGLSAGGGTSQPSSNFSTMNRPIHGQGYDDTTLSTRTVNRAAYPNGHNQMEGNPMIQGHSNPAMARDQQDHMMYGSKGHMNEIPLQDMGPGYSPIDEQRNIRNKPPVGGVPLFPNLPPSQQMPPPGSSPSQEPLYARVNKKRRDEMAEGQLGPSGVALDGGQEGGQEGADSWV